MSIKHRHVVVPLKLVTNLLISTDQHTALNKPDKRIFKFGDLQRGTTMKYFHVPLIRVTLWQLTLTHCCNLVERYLSAFIFVSFPLLLYYSYYCLYVIFYDIFYRCPRLQRKFTGDRCLPVHAIARVPIWLPEWITLRDPHHRT